MNNDRLKEILQQTRALIQKAEEIKTEMKAQVDADNRSEERRKAENERKDQNTRKGRGE